jgi:hypothetical protein
MRNFGPMDYEISAADRLHVISAAVVEAARDSLVIGPAKAEYDK